MINSLKDRLTEDFQKAKATGSPRVARVSEAFRKAAAQAMIEVKEGSGEVRDIAKDTFSSISEDFNATRDGVTDPSETASSVRLKSLLANVIKIVKQGFNKFVKEYNTAKAQAEATDSVSPQGWEHKKAEVEVKVGEAGSILAKKEQQVRQQLKEILQTTAAKL
jgi:hypothetical protein